MVVYLLYFQDSMVVKLVLILGYFCFKLFNLMCLHLLVTMMMLLCVQQSVTVITAGVYMGEYGQLTCTCVAKQ